MGKTERGGRMAGVNGKKVMRLAVPFVVLACMLFVLVWPCCASGAQEAPKGRLYLVSVGNGDPDNITLRALNTIKRSDIIFCMDGIRKAFPELIQGKEVHDTALLVHRTFMQRQGDYEKALKEVDKIEKVVRKAMKEGRTVSVVDAGDPTIYGPNMWFMEVFEDLDPEIIPGVSSFNAANAALKKGVTSGETTRSVVLTNGLDAEKLARGRTTMVFFTMHVDVPGIVKKLRAYYPPQTPVAIVANAGYTGKERIIRGTLDTIEGLSKGEELSMYLVYVGDFLTRKYGIKDKRGQADTRAQRGKEASIR